MINFVSFPLFFSSESCVVFLTTFFEVVLTDEISLFLPCFHRVHVGHKNTLKRIGCILWNAMLFYFSLTDVLFLNQ